MDNTQRGLTHGPMVLGLDHLPGQGLMGKVLCPSWPKPFCSSGAPWAFSMGHFKGILRVTPEPNLGLKLTCHIWEVDSQQTAWPPRPQPFNLQTEDPWALMGPWKITLYPGADSESRPWPSSKRQTEVASPRFGQWYSHCRPTHMAVLPELRSARDPQFPSPIVWLCGLPRAVLLTASWREEAGSKGPRVQLGSFGRQGRGALCRPWPSNKD